MKKSFLLVLIGILAASTAWGAATVVINATVGSQLDVSVDAITWTIELNNTGTAITKDSQGMLTVKASKSNYTVTFSSVNDGFLKKVGGTETIPYLIKVNTSEWEEGVGQNNLSTYKQLTAQETKTIVFNKKTPTAGITFPIGFMIASYTEYYSEGTYTDTLTIDITSP